MYNYFSITTFTLNTSGGAEIVTEKCTKEVEGKVTPCNESESVLKMLNKISSVGGNKSTQSIRCVLFNPNGDIIKIEEVIKSTDPIVDAKQIAIDKAVADYKANPTDENLAKIKEAVTAE